MSNQNKWFKHYNTASDGNSLDLLFAKQDYETIVLFWRLLEFISKYETYERRGFCVISYSLLKRKLGWNRQRSAKVLSKIALSFTLETQVQTDGEHIAVFHPKWLELQENRGGKKSSKTFQNTDRRKTETKTETKTKKKEDPASSWIRRIEEVYVNHYPNKKGKSKGLLKLAKEIKTEKDLEDLTAAVTNYASDCQTNKIDVKYIKHFSTFASEWRDWIVVEKDKKFSTIVATQSRTSW